MTRATRLSPDERRTALIEATRPLLIEHGLEVTTRQIAEAAGVAEGTIFRVFDTKDALVCAVMRDALSPDALVDLIRAVPDLALVDALPWLVGLLQESVRQLRSLFLALGGPTPGHKTAHQPAHEERSAATTAALVEVLSRYEDELRVSPHTAAWMIKAVAYAHAHPVTDDPTITDPRLLTDLILNGIAEAN